MLQAPGLPFDVPRGMIPCPGSLDVLLDLTVRENGPDTGFVNGEETKTATRR